MATSPPTVTDRPARAPRRLWSRTGNALAAGVILVWLFPVYWVVLTETVSNLGVLRRRRRIGRA